MEKCTLNLKAEKNRAQSNHRVPILSCIVMIAMCLIAISCSNLENDLSIEPSEGGAEANATSSVQSDIPASQKCISIGQEITDRLTAYNAAFVAEDVDRLYNDFWPLDHHTFVPNWNKNREEMRTQMTWFYERGNLYSYTLKSLDRYVYNDVVYDFGAGNSDGEMNGIQFINYDFYFIRWKKEEDGVWRVDKNVGGPRGNTSEVIPTTDEGPVTCHNTHQSGNTVGNNEVISQEITARYNEYRAALTAGNADEVYNFWTPDFHYYGTGLDVTRDGLYDYYHQYFQTGQILSSNPTLFYRYVHGNVVYDIGQADDTEVVNGVQSLKKKNYIMRWEKGQDNVWRISRIMYLFRVN